MSNCRGAAHALVIELAAVGIACLALLYPVVQAVGDELVGISTNLLMGIMGGLIGLLLVLGAWAIDRRLTHSETAAHHDRTEIKGRIARLEQNVEAHEAFVRNQLTTLLGMIGAQNERLARLNAEHTGLKKKIDNGAA